MTPNDSRPQSPAPVATTLRNADLDSVVAGGGGGGGRGKGGGRRGRPRPPSGGVGGRR